MDNQSKEHRLGKKLAHEFTPYIPQHAQRTDKIPPMPSSLIDEADVLFNVRLATSSDHLGVQMELVYAFIDRVSQHVTPFTSCKRGCSHCCRNDVQLTSIEASYIHWKTGIPCRTDTPLTVGHQGEACPFLADSGECGIYSHRPMLCRTYHSLSDPTLCALPSVRIEQIGTVHGGMSNIFYQGAWDWVNHWNKQIGSAGIKDIRDFFPEARSQVQANLAPNINRISEK